MQGPQDDVQEGKGLMIIELGKYNETDALLIETASTGLWGHVCYQDEDQNVSVTMVAVHMGVKEIGMQTGHRGTYDWPPSQE